jgi:hypothetical protein
LSARTRDTLDDEPDSLPGAETDDAVEPRCTATGATGEEDAERYGSNMGEGDGDATGDGPFTGCFLGIRRTEAFIVFLLKQKK